MTHDELLALIDRCEDFAASVGGTSGTGTALRAVVELHKPIVSNDRDGHTCLACSSELSVAHPCPTIQAIEKELK